MPKIIPSLRKCVVHRLVVMCLMPASGIIQAETWVISDRNLPISVSADVRVILLDKQVHLENRLSDELPVDPNHAAATIQRYLSSPAGKRLQNDLASAQKGLTDAWSLGIEKIPAVVVDRRYVIYGEADVAKAVERIKQARGSLQ